MFNGRKADAGTRLGGEAPEMTLNEADRTAIERPLASGRTAGRGRRAGPGRNLRARRGDLPAVAVGLLRGRPGLDREA